MKKILSVLLIAALVMCSVSTSFASELELSFGSIPESGFSGMNDPNLLWFTEDTVYESLVTALDSEEFFVEDVSAVYISQEYLDELAFNSQANIYFGHTLQEFADQFQGRKYIFTLGDDGTTIVAEFEDYDDTYDYAMKNVAIGTGVILVCVTVSIVTGGIGAPAVSMIFATSAKTGTIMALSGASIGGISAGIVTAVQTGNTEEALKAAARAGSTGFKWGAISGIIHGGISEYSESEMLIDISLEDLSLQQIVKIQKQTKYPLDVLKKITSKKQYKACMDAGLRAVKVNGKTSLIRAIDLDYPDEKGLTNLQRMKKGLAPIDPKSNAPYDLYRIGEKADSTLAILTKEEYAQSEMSTIWHEFGILAESDNPALQSNELLQKQTFWKQLAALLEEGV